MTPIRTPAEVRAAAQKAGRATAPWLGWSRHARSRQMKRGISTAAAIDAVEHPDTFRLDTKFPRRGHFVRGGIDVIVDLVDAVVVTVLRTNNPAQIVA